MSAERIVLRGVRVHNLKDVDLDLPHDRLIAFCGVSGSGKTSMALDTLYAEGQRRYLESFSTYSRFFLEQFDKPDADTIEGLPPSIAVVRQASSTQLSGRTTVGTATEITEYLRLLFAKLGHIVCMGCGETVRQETPESMVDLIQSTFPQGRLMVVFPVTVTGEEETQTTCQTLLHDGFIRIVHAGKTVDLSSAEAPDILSETDAEFLVIADRLRAETTTRERLTEAIELALDKGQGQCGMLAEDTDTTSVETIQLDGRSWAYRTFSESLRCTRCRIDYAQPEPKLYSFNSPLGACTDCEGFGNVLRMDMSLVVPDSTKSLRDGAIAPWNTPAYAHELEELLELAPDYDLPVDIPFSELSPHQLGLVEHGVPERDFGGLDGFFSWLQRHRYKTGVRVFLRRWQHSHTCTSCGGTRLGAQALAAKIDGSSIADWCEQRVNELLPRIQGIQWNDAEQAIARVALEQVLNRLKYLDSVGLGYLTLDRTVRTLSSGEAQRVGLTSALASNLIDLLYVLDEPSAGLHPTDVERLSQEVQRLQNRGNTVVVVEHEEAFLHLADHVVEFGPAAGAEGGEIVFQGSSQDLLADPGSLTGSYLAGRRGIGLPAERRKPDRGQIRIQGACQNNLQDIDVDLPLGVLCLVTGVSGAGKSTLIQDTLYPALAQQLRQEPIRPTGTRAVLGVGQVDDVLLVDQSPIARSQRSNPVTYVKAFDDIRAVFANTIEAKTHNYTASHFSFNVDGGRCDACKGDGFVAIDMQFMPDVYVSCRDCGGHRYRREILDVTYRGKSIADVLKMTAREAFLFFRGQIKVQTKLKRLVDVGLDYLQLGQPANTLSSGEAQRLKLAGYLSTASRKRTVILLDEPTVGLHFADVTKLLDCFDALISVGHSLIVIEHNVQVMLAADHIVDLGPGAAEQGGQVVATGTPEQIAQVAESVTGQCLHAALQRRER